MGRNFVLRRRLSGYALGTSGIALGMALASPAAAQCAPDPTIIGQAVTCTGTDPDGVTVATPSPITVVSGATVQAGAGRPGAITLAQPAGGGATLTRLDNAGTIVSTRGLAIAPQGNAGFVGLTALDNRAGAMIAGSAGAIGVTVERLTNAGRIDGGTGSVYALPSVTGTVLFPTSIINSGTMTSASTAATLQLRFGSPNVANSGRLENTGTGLVIDSGSNSLSVNNAAGGVIAAAGGSALRSSFQVTLINAGTITGSVLGGTGFFDRIDTRAGTINGDVRLDAGDDLLIARIGDAQLVGGITGTIDGGTGTDVLELIVGADRVLGATPVLPTGFEVLQLDLANNARLTVAAAPLAGGYYVRGTGTVVIGADIITTGRVLNPSYVRVNLGFESLNFVNDRSVTTTLATARDTAIQLDQVGAFNNSGTITAIGGNGVQLQTNQSALVSNGGTITASGTALAANGQFVNTGTVRSTGGVAVSNGLGGGGIRSITSTNSGRIEGATTGYALDALVLVNTGTISATAGVGVTMSYATLDNRAGGVISGTQAAIRADGFSGAYIANAGAVLGNVDLGGTSPFSSSADWFIDRGGSVAGDVLMGAGDDVFVTQLSRAGGGVSGTIDGGAGFDTFRYVTAIDASAVIAPRAMFEAVGYQVNNGAALTLTTAGPLTAPLTLSGTGSVDVTADIAGGTRPLIDLTRTALPPFSRLGEDMQVNDLDVVSRGALRLAVTTTDGFSNPTAVSVGSSTFENAGTIDVSNNSTSGLAVTAIFGTMGATIVNSGRIVSDGGRGALSVTGVRGAVTLINTGTIAVSGQAAVLGDFFSGLGAITNSGTLASSTGIAVTGDGSGTITNQAGGVIRGGTTADGAQQAAIRLSGGSFTNAGSIIGTVNLGFSQFGGSFRQATYVADGGTIAGDLLFGNVNDTLVAFSAPGVSGTIDGGAGIDTYVQARRSSDTVTLGANLLNFERQGARAVGTDTVVTLRADAPVAGDIVLSGDGAFVNTAMITGAVIGSNPGSFVNGEFQAGPPLAAFTNAGTIGFSVSGTISSVANSGTIGAETLAGTAVRVSAPGSLSFANDGQIASSGSSIAVLLSAEGSGVSAVNTGTITNGLYGEAYRFDDQADNALAPASVSLTNSGTITRTTAGRFGTLLVTDLLPGTNSNVTLVNSGTIDTSGEGGTGAALGVYGMLDGTTHQLRVDNSGTLRANGGSGETVMIGESVTERTTMPAFGLRFLTLDTVSGTRPVATVVNAAGGTIEATGTRSAAIGAEDVALDLANAGTIRGTSGSVLADDDQLAIKLGTPFLAGAIQSFGATDDRIVNTGTIIGSVALGGGADAIENYGRIEGDVFLGSGDDSFLQRASAVLTGTVDGGLGTDGLVIDATGGGAVNGDQFVNFERFSQTGEGNVAYSGNFRFDTIGLAGGTISVGEGQTLGSAGGTTVTGTDANETLDNRGTILGGVDLRGGNDRVDSRGAILSAVALGDGNDVFVDYSGSRVGGGVDGGAGSDLYRFVMAGDRAATGTRTGFETISVEGVGAIGGSGTLELTLDQAIDRVSLLGTGLNLSLGGFAVGEVVGSAAGETLAVNGDLALVDLGAGDDALTLATARANGRYAGGAGSDTLRFASTDPVVLAGTVTGFEQVLLAGNALTVTGTLGSAGAGLAFGDGAQALTVASGGTLAGIVDLGAGDDRLTLAAGSTLAGSVAGGAGNDAATLVLTGNRTLAGGVLTGFEQLETQGTGALTLTGTQNYKRIVSGGGLAIAADATVAADSVTFGAGDDRLEIAGRFTSGVDGGAGSDTVAVTGGTAAFSTIANVERFIQTGGLATIAGNAALGSADLSGGQLFGAAGSAITASRIAVARGATFGSAGSVTGDLAIAGTLSPGNAGVGTMTVNGNVALAGGSLSMFEIAATGADRLQVNGAVSIASGATLQLAPIGTVRAGTSYDLIVASGGITGSFASVVKPDTLFGFVVQRADRIQLLGQFIGNAAFSPQVSRSIAYANTVLQAQAATSSLFAAVPALLNADGSSNAQAFAQVTPEAYASATQAGVDNALTLAGAARGPAFATLREDPGLFTFGEAVGQWHTLGADPREGTSRARTRGYGFLGGVGYGSTDLSVGAFGGYLDTRQTTGALGAETKADGFVAGVHARDISGGLGLTASVLYDGGEARTRRTLPGATRATGRYDLHSWVGDLSLSYAMDMGAEWSLRPRLGVTYLRTTRDGTVEADGPFALTVARDQHKAGFVDGGFLVARSDASTAPLRPFVALGARYQFEGRRTDALAAYAGGPLSLEALGASRARVVGTASAGIAYRLGSGLDLFSTASAQTGRDDHQETITTGVRLRF